MSRKSLCCAIILPLLLSPSSPLVAAEQAAANFYVAPDGNDIWSGRLAEANSDGSDGPLATLEGAQQVVRRLKQQGALTAPIRVLLREGTYRVTRPITFGPEDSGSKQVPITYAAYPGEHPVISGAVPITGWKKSGESLWATVVPAVKEGKWYFRQLFIDGRRAIPARTPNEGAFRIAGPIVPLQAPVEAKQEEANKNAFVFNDEDLKPWADLDDAVVVVYHTWATSLHRIKSLDTTKRIVEFTAPAPWPMGNWKQEKQRYYVQSIREALDSPGEWYLDRKTGVLTYYPRPGEEMDQAELVAPLPQELLRLEGAPAAGKPVEYLRFENLAFQYTDWVMPPPGMLDMQAAVEMHTAAIMAVGAQNCRFANCQIRHTGHYGIWLAQGSKDNAVVQCHLEDLGAGGICIGEQKLPKEVPLQTERNEVYNCFIHNGGNVLPAGVGVWIGKSSYNHVHHNEICDLFYSGISVGWNWDYGPSAAHDNIIEYNHIHHLGWGQLSDMGGIYTLGVSPGTVLRQNLIHDVLATSYGGWGLYTDEGSSQILLENNVVYRVTDGAFHQNIGRDNTVRNNILAYAATDGQIRRSSDEPHRSFTVERNIVYSNGAPLFGGNWSQSKAVFDYNTYWDATGKQPRFPGDLTLAQWQAKGQDIHSLLADPEFVDATHYDFRLKPDSPALKSGFKPIDTTTIGLVGPPAWVNLPKQVQRSVMRMPGEP